MYAHDQFELNTACYVVSKEWRREREREREEIKERKNEREREREKEREMFWDCFVSLSFPCLCLSMPKEDSCFQSWTTTSCGQSNENPDTSTALLLFGKDDVHAPFVSIKSARAVGDRLMPLNSGRLCFKEEVSVFAQITKSRGKDDAPHFLLLLRGWS